MKEEQGTGQSLMVLGSSGYGTFVDQMGDLASVLDRYVEAKILLVNPFGADASARIQAQGIRRWQPFARRCGRALRCSSA
ncbi:MAG: hypothetical protein U0231_13785 [Nitrospiraceae bacterium]